MTRSEALRFITDFYRNPNPGKDDMFLFEEAELFLINTYHNPSDMNNLAFHYLEQRRHDLELKYLEMAAEYDYPAAVEELGFVWYYGQTGEVDYKKAYEYFSAAASLDDDVVKAWSEYKLADMYLNGYYVQKDEAKFRSMIEALYAWIVNPGKLHSIYPSPELRLPHCDVYLRLARIRAQDGKTEEALKLLSDAREILSEDIRNNPAWWGNIEVMDEIVSLQYELGYEADRLDVFDLFGLAKKECVIAFLYEDRRFLIDIVREDDGVSVKFDHKWFRTVREFFEKAEIDGERIVYIYDELYDLEVSYE